MIKIVDNSIQIIDKMLDAIVNGKSSDERKQILEQDVKNITFKKIDRTYLKELSDEIKNLEKSKKSEKDARKTEKTQALLEQLKNIEKVARMPDMQKQGIFFQEEREEQMRLEEERRLQEEEAQRKVEELRREREENIGMAEEEEQTINFNAKENEERERIRVLREKRLKREQEQREAEERERREAEEADLIRRYEELSRASEKLSEELVFVRESRNQLSTDAFPRFISTIFTVNRLFPDLTRNDVAALVREYIFAVRNGTDVSNTFINDLFEKSETDGSTLVALANEISRLDSQERRITEEMDDIQREIARISTKFSDALDDRVENFFDDTEADLAVEPAPAPAPEPAAAPKPKKEETAKVKKLYETSQYSSDAEKITLIDNDFVYFRNKEQFIKSQNKATLVDLLDKLNIDYKKWSSTTKGDNETNVKAFRTKAFEILKDNPRLKLKGGTHWFKTPK
jgi:hypothetical protein